MLMLGGCALQRGVVPVADLVNYVQDSSVYIENMPSKSRLLERQKHYEEHYFSPWKMRQPPITRFEAKWAFRRYKAGESYGENLLPIDASWFHTMVQQSNFNAYGSVNRYAISRHFTHLRAFPTHKPLFSDPSQAGEGFPFDYMQNSGVHSNEPLLVSHYSKDGAWVYVFTSYASGWVRHRDIVLLTEAQTQAYKRNRFVHVIHDGTALRDANGSFVTYGRVGMMLPYYDINTTHYTVMVHNGSRFTAAALPRQDAHSGPMLLRRENMTALMNELLGKNYGWGGMYEERDCSSTLRDMFASFGIWLPRNSSQQATIGKIISLKGLNADQKRTRIIEQGVPFETILYRRGHVLLYLGLFQGKIMVFHDTWGIRTVKDGVAGRKIVGKTVISTLELGKEQPDYDARYAHLKHLESMNIMTQEATTP